MQIRKQGRIRYIRIRFDLTKKINDNNGLTPALTVAQDPGLLLP